MAVKEALKERIIPEVIVIRETWEDSMKKDFFLVVTFVLMIGLGVALDSSAMQWIGGLLWLVILYNRIMDAVKKLRLSIPEARLRLDEIEKDMKAGK